MYEILNMTIRTHLSRFQLRNLYKVQQPIWRLKENNFTCIRVFTAKLAMSSSTHTVL